ncbi:MAG: hypothetical protein PHI58_04145 [Candidatus Omnitrophica bacterium]|nr:hypothetical protein [Candidatus Omnitrophota bacterium]
MKRKPFFFLIMSCALSAAILTGCGPTYPKEKFADSIVRVCKREYKLDVKVATMGKTVAIYVPLQELWDMTFALTKRAGEEINDVILTVSRVSLSTDADYNFYVVIAYDVRIPEIQIIIIKSVEDVKRFMLNDISRGEFAKRMLIDKRINPQAKKEHAVKEVFEKMGLDKKWQDSVMNDFFRAQPAALGDIGYWNDRFYIKDISKPEFLAEQIATRVRMDFFEDKVLSETIVIKASKGSYLSEGNKRYFRIEVLPEPKSFSQLGTVEMVNSVFKKSLEVAAHVLHGYQFKDYDYIEIADETSGRSFKATKDQAEKFRLKKLTFDNILSTNI